MRNKKKRTPMKKTQLVFCQLASDDRLQSVERKLHAALGCEWVVSCTGSNGVVRLAIRLTKQRHLVTIESRVKRVASASGSSSSFMRISEYRSGLVLHRGDSFAAALFVDGNWRKGPKTDDEVRKWVPAEEEDGYFCEEEEGGSTTTDGEGGSGGVDVEKKKDDKPSPEEVVETLRAQVLELQQTIMLMTSGCPDDAVVAHYRRETKRLRKELDETNHMLEGTRAKLCNVERELSLRVDSARGAGRC